MTKFLTLDDFDFKGKRVIIRPDFNVPLDPETKEILDDSRIRAHAETINELSEKGAKVVVIAHQGRPKQPDYTESMEKHAKKLEEIIGKPVKYVHDLYGDIAKKAIKELKQGEILVLKNVRSFPEERKKKSPEEHAKSELVKELAPLADIFVLDGFSVAHRSHASVVGFAVVLPSCAGRVMERELNALNKALQNPEKPYIAILGGAKAEKCIDIIGYLLENNIADNVLTGGLIGQIFLLAKGVNIGEPNVEVLKKKGLYELVPKMQELLKKFGEKIKIPSDVAIEVDGKREEIDVSELPTKEPIYDIGRKTVEQYSKFIEKAKTILLSGPLGVYEKNQFIAGTKEICEAIVRSKAFTLAGGGDTLAALKKLGVYEKFSYVSLAGGAFIEYLTGAKLPGVEVLEKAALRK